MKHYWYGGELDGEEIKYEFAQDCRLAIKVPEAHNLRKAIFSSGEDDPVDIVNHTVVIWQHAVMFNKSLMEEHHYYVRADLYDKMIRG